MKKCILIRTHINRPIGLFYEIMTDTKEKILESAFVLFLKKNYSGVSMSDLQRHTKLSRGAIYHHFKSKEEIQCQVIDLYFFPALKTMSISNVSDFQEPLKEAIQLTIDKRVSFMNRLQKINSEQLDDFHFFKLAFQADEFYPNFKEKIYKLKQKEEQIWKQILTLAIKKKEIKKEINIEDTAKLLMIIPEGLGVNNSFKSGLTKIDLKKAYMQLYNLIKK